MIGEKHQPELEPEMTHEEEEAEDEEERNVLLRKTSRQHAQSSISSSTDSDEIFSGNSQGLQFIIRDQQHQQQNQGTGYSNGSSRLEIDGDHPVYEVIPSDEIEVVDTRKTDAQNGTTIKFQRDHSRSLAFANPPSNGAIENQASYYTSLDNGTSGYKRVELRTENGTEVTDLYLERIYEKPSSHNFYCPNCQACITKVIIRDREWVNNTVSAPAPTQVDKFRCTSCLSFLVPIGNNVENIEYREREIFQVQETRDSQESQVDRAPVPNQSVDNAVADKNEVGPDPSVGNAVADQTRDIHAVSDSKPTHPFLNPTVAEERVLPVKGVESKQGIQADSINKTQVPDQLVEFDMWTNDNTLETKVDSPVDSSILDGAKDTKKGITVENIVVGIPYTSHESNGSVQDDNQTSRVNKVLVQNQSNGFAVLSKSETDTRADSTPGHTESATDTFDEKKGIDVENVVVGIPYPSLESKGGLLDRFRLPAFFNKTPVPDQSAAVAKTEIPKTPEFVEATEPDSSPFSPSLEAPTTVERATDTAVGSREGPVAISIDDSLDEQIEPEPSRYNWWEIVKCIVYGGLAESIASLGIVTSAASGNTGTRNIVVLSLANLISGLFILGHNLTGLKSEQFRTSNETDDDDRVDRYEVVLGNRENYILHFVLAIFSFVFFGLVPPLVYGFSFTKSNDKDLKLAAVAGASLLCIILLALGKAYIQRPNRWDVYIKTVASYIVIAAGAGGFSYLAGSLIDKCIKKYGWFEEENPASFNLGLPLPEMSLVKAAWGSS